MEPNGEVAHKLKNDKETYNETGLAKEKETKVERYARIFVGIVFQRFQRCISQNNMNAHRVIVLKIRCR